MSRTYYIWALVRQVGEGKKIIIKDNPKYWPTISTHHSSPIDPQNGFHRLLLPSIPTIFFRSRRRIHHHNHRQPPHRPPPPLTSASSRLVSFIHGGFEGAFATCKIIFFHLL
ncbi:unnamed protein product [Lactuca virosa]|uniref:Uncharacterized protein n=1 Tax=Lactuca virosa TaxID=75947 RepID=A0AAU9N3H5_9ASTR|nr:unnamed protein product [Lactuca virosa]